MANDLSVLVVDHHDKQLDLLCSWLSDAGYEPIPADDLSSGLRNLYNYHPDAIILSLDAIGPSYPSAVKRIRELCDTPVILITSRSTPVSLQDASDLGLDGYLIKPLNPDQLLNRLAAAIQRINGRGIHGNIFRHENLTIDWKRLEVLIDDQPVHLTPLEFRLLTFLVKHRGWVLSYDQILSNVWGSNYCGDRSNVKLYTWYLRRKLESDPAEPRWILTRYGIGYSFVDESALSTAQGPEGTAPPLPVPSGLD